MRMGLYVRVSSEEQAKEGYSVPAQLRTLNAWAIVKGATSVTEYIDDGYSAKNLNRPDVMRLIEDCRAKKLDVVVVWRLDRLSRNMRDLLVTIEDDFKPNGVEFISTTEAIDTTTSSGRLMLNVIGAFAQNEREVNAERVSMVMMELAKQCKHLGGQPVYGLGVANDKSYYIDEKEAVGLRMAVRMRIEGHSINEIIAAMTAQGYLTRKGTPFTATGLYEIFRNPKIAGYYTYNRTASAQRNGKRNNHSYKKDSDIIFIPGGIPAIITGEEWSLLQIQNEKGLFIGGQNTAKNIYIVSGLCFCGKCGGRMNITNGGKNRDGSYWRVYRCKNKCVPGVEYKKMDRAVIECLKESASDPTLIDRAVNILREFARMQQEDAQTDVKELRERLAELDKSKSNIIAFITKNGGDAPPSMMLELKQIDAEYESIRSRIDHINHDQIFVDRAEIEARIKEIIDIESMTDADKKEIVRQLVEKIIVHEDKIEIILTTGYGGADPLPEAIVKLFTFYVARSMVMQKKA